MSNSLTLRRLSAIIFFTMLGLTAKAEFEPADTIHLQNDSAFVGFETLDSMDLSSDVYISGENHTFLTSNSRLWVKMLKYLYKNAGVRNIMIEYGFSSGYLINRYIQTGDTNDYNVLKKYSFEQHAWAYKQLKEFNDSLPEGEKIHLMGIDLERGTRLAAKVMGMMIPDSGIAHDSIALHIESLRSLVSYNDNEVYNEDREFFYYDSYSVSNTLVRVMKNFIRHEDKYKAFLPEENFRVFKKVALGIKDLRTWNSFEDDNSTHEFVYREMYMYNRFLEEYAARDGKFYGQFGRCHSAKVDQEETSCNWFHFRSLASRIEQTVIDGKELDIFTMGILYPGDDYDVAGWEGIKDWADDRIEELDAQRLAIYDFSNDTISEKLQDMFDLVIINSYNPDANYPTTPLVYDDLRYNEFETITKVLFIYTELSYDYSSVNSFLRSELNIPEGESDPISTPIRSYGFEVKTIDPLTGLGSGSSFVWQTGINIDGGENLSMKLSGWRYMSDFIYQLPMRRKSLFNFDAVAGIGYVQNKLEINRTLTEPDLNNGAFTKYSTSVYRNPAIVFELGAGVDVNIKSFTVGARAFQIFDVSKKGWISGDEYDDANQLSFNGLFINYTVGFNF